MQTLALKAGLKEWECACRNPRDLASFVRIQGLATLHSEQSVVAGVLVARRDKLAPLSNRRLPCCQFLLFRQLCLLHMTLTHHVRPTLAHHQTW